MATPCRVIKGPQLASCHPLRLSTFILTQVAQVNANGTAIVQPQQQQPAAGNRINISLPVRNFKQQVACSHHP